VIVFTVRELFLVVRLSGGVMKASIKVLVLGILGGVNVSYTGGGRVLRSLYP